MFTGEDLRYQKISARDVGSRAYLKNRNRPATFGALAEKDDASADEFNHTHLMYTVVVREAEIVTWSDPQFVDTDNTTADDSSYSIMLEIELPSSGAPQRFSV